MNAFNLFHQPSFNDKLAKIESRTQLCALLAAMTSYASHFDKEPECPNPSTLLSPGGLMFNSSHQQQQRPKPDEFLRKALEFVDEALAECDDEQPPICVIQALVIATHCQLTRGVHGKASRSLGLCVSLAYELNLHLIDALDAATRSHNPHHHHRPHHLNSNPLEWRYDEEKRRAWWAIWEMDVFASSIKRKPTAISWSQMETYLPVDDCHWFQDEPIPSTFMERDPEQRWRALQSTQNESPKAWFLVINSLMKDAQVLSSPHGVRLDAAISNQQQRKDRNKIQQQLEMLRNAVQCFVLALPSHLRYRSQYLSFDQSASHRQLHCHIYSIFVMTQLARLMIYRYDLFREEPTVTTDDDWPTDNVSPSPSSSWGQRLLHSPAVGQYFEAADNILGIVNGSCEEHIQYINPFLLSGIWLASAVQLVRKCVDQQPSPSARSRLIKSRFDVLYLTYKRCVDFWGTKTALQQNLEILEVQLEAHFESELNGIQGMTPSPGAKRRRRSSIDSPSWVPEEQKNNSSGTRPSPRVVTYNQGKHDISS